MPKQQEPDPLGGVFRWTWTRGKKHLDRFAIGGAVLGLASILVSNVFVAPQNATPLKRVAYSLLPFVAALLISTGAAFGWAFMRAPYEQRDALRGIVKAERTKFDQELAQSKRDLQQQSPDFLGRIEQVMGGTERERPGVLGVFVNMSILNRGAPSVVDHFDAVVTLGGLRRQVPMVVIAPNTTFEISPKNVIRITSSDAIYEKATARLERGAQIRGWLRVEIADMTNEQFFRAGNSIEITFADFLGKSYVASQVMTGASSGQFMYLPGSQNLGQSFSSKLNRRQRRSKR